MSRPGLVFAGTIALAFVLPSCKNDLDRVSAVEVPVSAPDRVTTDAEYFYSDSGHVSNRLRAGRVEEYNSVPEPHTELSNDLELVFYPATGTGTSVLTARRGRIWPGNNRMEVHDQVVFTNARGERLETEELIWSQDSGRVHTDRPVRIVRQHDIIYGQGLDASQDFSSYSVHKITGTLFPSGADSIH